MVNLDSNFCLFIRALAEKKRITNISATSKALQISRRMIYHYIDKLNDLLAEHDLGRVQKKKHGVICLSDYQAVFILEYLQTSNSESYILTTVERRQIIILLILLGNSKLYLKNFSTMFGVSRNTILKDIQFAKKKLAQSEKPCFLQSNKQFGYFFIVDEMTRRSKIYQAIQEIDYRQSENVFLFLMKEVLRNQHFINVPNIVQLFEYIEMCIRKTKQILNKEISEFEVKILARSMIFFLNRSWLGQSIHYDQEQKQIITERLEYLAAEKLIADLEYLLNRKIPEDEMLFLGMLLLCTEKNTDFHYKSSPFEELVSITESIVEHFEQISGVYFKMRDCLIENIQTHIKVTYYRNKFQIFTPLVEFSQILSKYEKVYRLTKKAFVNLNENELLLKYFPEGLKDDEIASIALFFEDAIMKEQSRSSFKQLIIISDFANVFNSLLYTQVKQLISGVIIKGIFTTKEGILDNLYADYCITTNRDYIHPSGRTVFVNIVLTKEDKDRIITVCKPIADFNRVKKLKVKQLIEEFNFPLDTNDFLMKLERILDDGNNGFLNDEQSSLERPWNADNFFRVSQVSSLDEGIDIVAVPLLKDKFIQNSYVEQICRDIYVKKRTMFIFPKVLLLHTDYRHGSFHPGISMLYMEKSLFLNDDPNLEVKLIILLSTDEKMEHVQILFEIDQLIKADFLSELEKGTTMEEAFFKCAMRVERGETIGI